MCRRKKDHDFIEAELDAHRFSIENKVIKLKF